jgi:hypothetical protein
MSSVENLRVDSWEAEWEEIQRDMELYPQNNVQKLLLDVLEGKLYSRWLPVHNDRMEAEDALGDAQGVEYVVIKDELPEEVKACQNELFIYRSRLESKFGIIFLMTFSLLTFLPLFLLSFIWSVQYQPLVYLLFIPAMTITYFAPPFERRLEHHLRCYAVPVIVTVHWLVSSSGMPFKTVAYLWLFTTCYYILLRVATWKIIDKVKKYFDPLGYAYLLTIRNLK